MHAKYETLTWNIFPKASINIRNCMTLSNEEQKNLAKIKGQKSAGDNLHHFDMLELPVKNKL